MEREFGGMEGAICKVFVAKAPKVLVTIRLYKARFLILGMMLQREIERWRSIRGLDLKAAEKGSFEKASSIFPRHSGNSCFMYLSTRRSPFIKSFSPRIELTSAQFWEQAWHLCIHLEWLEKVSFDRLRRAFWKCYHPIWTRLEDVKCYQNHYS